MGYKLTEAARKDLREIVYYIALDNETAAERVYQSILDTCKRAAEMPDLGRNHKFVPNTSILCMNVKKYLQYLIFFRKKNGNVEVIRIVHGARKFPDIFSD